MSVLKRCLFTGFLALFMVCLAIPLFTDNSYAGGDFVLESDSIVFDEYSAEDSTEWIYTAGGSVAIKDAVSADENVATVTHTQSRIIVDPVKEGKTTITVTGINDLTFTVQVTVDRSYFTQRLKNYLSLSNYWYGTQKIYVYVYPGSKGTMKIGKTTYKFTVGESGSVKIKLKKVYKLNTKIKVTVTHNGYTVTRNFKIYSGASFDEVKASKHKVKILTNNLHKGDTIKVIYKKKAYTYKVKKNYDCKYKLFAIKVKKTLKKNSSLKIKIVNKDKKTLMVQKIKLDKWRFIQPDEISE